MQTAILAKIARSAKVNGLTVNSESATGVVIENGSNDLTITLVDQTFTPSIVGGVDPTVSPFLGIGTAAPCRIKMKGVTVGATPGIADVLDTVIAAKVFAILTRFANDIVLENGATWTATIRGVGDLVNMGQ